MKNQKIKAIWDIECYTNYFLVMFLNPITGKTISFEMYNDSEVNRRRALAFVRRHTLIGFNSSNYDDVMLSAFLHGHTNKQLKELSDELVTSGRNIWDIKRDLPFQLHEFDSIDIAEPAPGVMVSLKLYGARIHTKKLQDLPLDPSTTIQDEHLDLMRLYCHNDLTLTSELYSAIEHEIVLRERMSAEYGQDLRSKGGAQVATAVLRHYLGEKGIDTNRPTLKKGVSFKYEIPEHITFKSAEMKAVLEKVRVATFTVEDSGKVKMPAELVKPIAFRNAVYKFGIGGLHSQEKAQTIIAAKDELLFERDVASMYPNLIIREKLFPEHLGEDFLNIYGDLIKRRMAAKRSGDGETSDSLKLVLNSSFGLFGSKYSFLYSPNLMIGVTITGQLSLLMLIERVTDIEGVRVVSANTDGVVILCSKEQYQEVDDVCFAWELDTGLELEENAYRSIHSASVNSYFAITTNGKVKTKGSYGVGGLSKNPNAIISTQAAIGYVLNGADIEKTIHDCTNIDLFAVSRTVNGGAVDSNDAPVGKVVRWYYGLDVIEPLRYARNGNKVPMSEGAVPILDTPEQLPCDIDYIHYINLAKERLKDAGYQNTN